MERYWTLRYLQQNGITELTATVLKEGPQGDALVRADSLPLVFGVLGAQGLPRGAQVRVQLGAIDEFTLDVRGTVLERLDTGTPPAADAQLDLDEGGEEGQEAAAGPITIAVDVADDTGDAADVTNAADAAQKAAPRAEADPTQAATAPITPVHAATE
jgi:exoribonuclease-2